MLARFCLYGFLKNQRYFEFFLVLALIERDLTFFEIGLLVAFRDIWVNVFEVPSGVVADVWGRRGALVVSFAAYIVSFVVFGFAGEIVWFYLAMFFFAIGEAFHSGTHKALIFAWLRETGRESERTRVYGYTRSWSKFGSAVGAVLAAIFVTVHGAYDSIFFYAIVPYAIALANVATYPARLDIAPERPRGFREAVTLFRAAFRDLAARPRLRRVMLESLGFQGVFDAVKDYIQPVLMAAAGASLAVLMTGASDLERTAALVGVVYAGLFAVAGFASRKAHRVSHRAGGDEAAARRIWLVYGSVFAILGLAALAPLWSVIIAAFICLHVLQNLWRPILIARIDDRADEQQGATVLSIESQAHRLGTIVLAPLIGAAVDAAGTLDPEMRFWPIGLAGAAVCLVALLTPARGRAAPPG